jgi:hypothetical protein
MAQLTGKFARERRTIEAMIGIYCRDHHEQRKGLCERCGEVFAYAELRLDKCLFPDNKPTCAHCPVHCYKPAMRDQVKQIMRYAGPRMIYNHPYLAIRHILDGRNKGPFVQRKPGQRSGEAAGPGPGDAAVTTAAAGGSASAGGCCAAAPDETAGPRDHLDTPAAGDRRPGGGHPG